MSIQADEPIALADMMLRQATRRDQLLAGVFFVAVLAASLQALHAGNAKGSTDLPFIPILAPLWGAADLLTAFLLWTQFSVNGVRAFAYLGGAYAYAGILTIPYIAYFPGLFHGASRFAGSQQISAWMWLTWHIVFPLVIAGYRAFDPQFRKRFLSGEEIRAGLRLAISSVVAGAVLAFCIIVFCNRWLPVLISGNHFTPVWSHVFMPLVFLLNGIAAVMMMGLGGKRSLLQVWVAIALAMAALDGLLNTWPSGPFTPRWYLGNAETFTTASVVMLVLLSEVGGLYRRLGTMAIVDPLTGLRNRRSFDEYLRWALGHRKKSAAAFLLLDIDCFKQYNDHYGHAAGDVCLRLVAKALLKSLRRPSDLVARYGGEEFAVLLPDTTATGALDVGERIRQGVETLAIPHAASAVSTVVTVSVGVAHTMRAEVADAPNLFALADRALYDAKVRRNSIVFSQVSRDDNSAVRELELHPLD